MLAPKSDVDPNAGNGRLASILFVLAWAWTVIPKVIQTVAVPKYRTYVTQEGAPPTALTSAAANLLLLSLLGFCVFVIVNALRSNPQLNLGVLLLMLAPWIYIAVRDWLSVDPFHLASLTYPLPVIAVWLLRPGLRELRVVGYLVGVVAVISVALGLALPSHAIFRAADGSVITEDKNLLPLGMLVGIYTHGNSLGQFLALGMPMVALIRRTAHRVPLLLISMLALIWSSARSSILSVVAMIVFVALLNAIPPRMRDLPTRLILFGVYAVVVFVPLLTRDPLAFTNRGYIWGASLLAWRSEPVFGFGSRYYTDLARTSGELGGTVYHGHNELVQLLVVGGLVLAAMVGVLLLTAIVKAARLSSQSLFWFATLFVLAGDSLLETSLSFVENTFLLPVMVLPLACLMFGPDVDGAPRQSRNADTTYLIANDQGRRSP